MAAFSSVAGFVVVVGSNPGISQELSEAAAPSGESVLAVGAGSGVRAEGMSAGSGDSFTSAGVEVGGATIFDNFHSIPTEKKLGMIGSVQTFPIEIWNTFRDLPLQIGQNNGSGVTVSGTGGTTLSGQSIPAKLGPMCSRIFTATVPESGSATVANTAKFEIYFDAFGGLGNGFVLVPITGLRIFPFPFDPDWTSGIKESIAYLTQFPSTARTGAEQRCRLRFKPRRSLEFALMAIDQAETQDLDSLIWKRHSGMFAVPWWPDGVQFSGSLAAGATSIAIDTTNRLFSLAPMVMIWHDAANCEVQSIQSVSAGLIQCNPLSASYSLPLILPAFPGRMDVEVELDRTTAAVTEGPVRFSCEVGLLDPRPSPAAMTQTYGYDVLEVEPNWEAPKQKARRILSILDNKMAPAFQADRGGVSFQSQSFRWFLEGRDQIQQFRDFVDRRAGRLVPFWVPTWREDMTLSQSSGPASTGIVIRSAGYTSRMFPDRARRYLAIRHPSSGGWIYRKVISSSEGIGIETLGLDEAVGVTLPVGTAVSFLVLSRLSADTTEIDWTSEGFAEATSTFVELPKEVPA